MAVPSKKQPGAGLRTQKHACSEICIYVVLIDAPRLDSGLRGEFSAWKVLLCFGKKILLYEGVLGFWGAVLLRVGLGEWGDGGWDGMGWDGMGWLVRGGFGARLKGLGTSRALFGRPCE